MGKFLVIRKSYKATVTYVRQAVLLFSHEPRSANNTRSGAPSTTTTGPRSTSSTRTESSATNTSARGATRNRSASYSGCSVSTANSSPSKGSAWRRKLTGTTCVRPSRISATAAASSSRPRTARPSTNAAPTGCPSACTSTSGASRARGRSGGSRSCWTKPAGPSPSGTTRRDAHLVMSAGSSAPIPFQVRIDGYAPGASHGVDIDEDGSGVLREGRLYQLVREPRRGPRADTGDHVPRARRRGVRLHVRLAIASTAWTTASGMFTGRSKLGSDSPGTLTAGPEARRSCTIDAERS